MRFRCFQPSSTRLRSSSSTNSSTDDTGAIVDRLSSEDPRVNAIHHVKNRGYGGALTSGFEASTGDHVMFMDSDRQFDILDIERLYPFIQTHEIVAGFRMLRQDKLIGGSSRRSSTSSCACFSASTYETSIAPSRFSMAI